MRSLALLLGVKAACILLVSSLSGTGAVNNSGRWWWVDHMLHAMMHSLSYQLSTTECSHLAPGWPQEQHFIGAPHSIPHARNNVLVLAPFTTSVQPLRGGGKKGKPHDIIACGIFSCRFQIAPCGLNYKQTFHLFIYLLYKRAVPQDKLFRADYIFLNRKRITIVMITILQIYLRCILFISLPQCFPVIWVAWFEHGTKPSVQCGIN